MDKESAARLAVPFVEVGDPVGVEGIDFPIPHRFPSEAMTHRFFCALENAHAQHVSCLHRLD